MVGSNFTSRVIIEEIGKKKTTDETMKDTPLIIISDDESVQDEPLTKKPRRLIKNDHNVNNHQVHVVSFADKNIVRKLNTRNLEHEIAKDENLEYDDDLPIHFKRTKKKNLPYDSKRSYKRVIDDSINDDEDVEDTKLNEEPNHLFDDEVTEDFQVDDEVLDESTHDLPHLDDFIDDYDYMDSFIDDSPIVDEDTENYSDSD